MDSNSSDEIFAAVNKGAKNVMPKKLKKVFSGETLAYPKSPILSCHHGLLIDSRITAISSMPLASPIQLMFLSWMIPHLHYPLVGL